MEELRIAFLVIGSVFIVGVLVHGIWKMRKQDEVPQREMPRTEPQSLDVKDADGFDDLGIGEVRVLASEKDIPEPQIDDDIQNVQSETLDSNTTPTSVSEDVHNDETPESKIEPEAEQAGEQEIEEAPVEAPLYASVVTQPKPQFKEKTTAKTDTSDDMDIPEPPEFLLKEEKSEPDFGLAATPAAPAPQPKAEPAPKKATKKRVASKRRKEPTIDEDQMRIDFDEPEKQSSQEPKVEQKQELEQEVLVINVRASEGESLSGAALLPLLLTLGFKFGDHDIFHRHVNANGKGPVLFSLANMVKPGVFDIDNLETFATQGVSLFMVLPIDGDPHQVFNMMHNAARKIADEFNAQLLDGRRSILTKQGVQQYMEKIREFERQRIISQSTH